MVVRIRFDWEPSDGLKKERKHREQNMIDQ